MKKYLTIVMCAAGLSSCSTYKQYYRTSTQLIDEMIVSNDAFFDTIGEGDLYDNYIEAKSKLSNRIKK